MSNQPPPPLSRLAILLTTLAILATAAGFGLYSLMGGGAGIFSYLVPVLLFIVVIGWKLAAPRLPWRQAAYAASSVLLVHLLAEHIVPLVFVVEKIIEVVCVAGFGTHWVKKGYIPKESNRWE